MIEVGMIIYGNCCFEFLDWIEDVGVQPLNTLGKRRVEWRDFREAVWSGFNSTAYLQAFGSEGNPKGFEASVAQDAKDVANVSSALFTEDFFAVISSTFFAHSSNASRFSSKYPWRL